MRILPTHLLHEAIDKKRLAGIATLLVALLAGLAGWYVRANASTPIPDAKPAIVPPSLTLLHSLYGKAPAATADPAATESAQRAAALLVEEAEREVNVRKKKLDKARRDYLRIRRTLTKAGLSDEYAELARERVEEAAESLHEAQMTLEQRQMARHARAQGIPPAPELLTTKK